MVFPWEHVPVTVYFSFIGLGVRSPFDLTSLYKFFCFCWATSLVTLIYNTYLHFDQKKKELSVLLVSSLYCKLVLLFLIYTILTFDQKKERALSLSILTMSGPGKFPRVESN